MSEITATERTMLSLIGEGLEKRAIAKQLRSNVLMVAFRQRRLYKKLGVPNAPAAVHYAFKNGLLPD
ncbi:LuxR C-terminal-related transcriptional regulator [Pontiella sp.]|uniref:LuxR C-terminal-related transcriptional regulator n=1 Tax=Pontiella sp. TaxID=2837462 RepID=UPI00356A7CB8